MAITDKDFKKLKAGDLVEWVNTVTTNPNTLGIVTQSYTFRDGNPKTTKFHQVIIKWSIYEDTCAYNEFDWRTLENLTLIAGAQQ